MKKELARIEKEISALWKQKQVILVSLNKKNDPILRKKYLGKCYKTKNSYGSGESWWLYKRVVAVERGYIETFDFELMCDDRFEARVNTGSYDKPQEDWKEISLEEFDEALSKSLLDITSRNCINEAK